MNLSALSQRALGTSKLYFKRHGPAILTGAGVVGFIGTNVLVARAAVKVKPKLEESKKDLRSIENRSIDANYTKKIQACEYGQVIISTARDLAKIYAPAIVLGGISITCVVSAHGMLKKQNTALVAAYGAIDLGFKAYRQRVIEEFGADKDRDIYRGVIERREVKDEETGQVCEIERYADVIPSIYGRFFDESSTQWSKTPEWNLTFLMHQQNYANDLLTINGHLFLNDVYKALGFPLTQAGQVVGWLKEGKDGDTYVDFGIHDIASEVSRAFVNGQERVIFLDFNVDGPILDTLD